MIANRKKLRQSVSTSYSRVAGRSCRVEILPPTLVRSGFTIVEMLVSMAIIGVLVSIAVPAIGRARLSMQRTRCVNNLRNVAFAITQYDHLHSRLPASGYYFDPPDQPSQPFHSWAVSILPWVDQGNVFDKWKLEEPITSANNRPLTRSKIPAYTCPLDVSLSGGIGGDLSYTVNGGVGFTFRNGSGVGDCPMSWQGHVLDLNGDGNTCSGTVADDKDRTIFKRLGVFFLENWKVGGTKRNHSIADIVDGSSQTFLVTENVRVGYDPTDSIRSFADPHQMRSAFYIGSPCLYGDCNAGGVDYARSNQGTGQINSGLDSPEGTSPVPNSFHVGGVNMAFADAHVQFLSESIEGAVFAALASSQGLLLNGTPLEQTIVSGDSF